tara:strand:- start:491 stop:2194 length:1704 start_codon:yes stop_codon:yes gene_type:complete
MNQFIKSLIPILFLILVYIILFLDQENNPYNKILKLDLNNSKNSFQQTNYTKTLLPIAHYKLNNQRWDSANNNHGNIIGELKADIDYIGNNNSAYKFNGNSIINIKNKQNFEFYSANNPNLKKLSISCWVKDTSDKDSCIISFQDGSNNNMGWGLFINQDKNIMLQFVKNNKELLQIKTSDNDKIINNEWHHIVCSLDFSKTINIDNMMIYLDGKLTVDTVIEYQNYDNITSENIFYKTAKLYIGGHHNSNKDDLFFEGSMSNIQIFDEILTKEHVKILYEHKNTTPKAILNLKGDIEDVSNNKYARLINSFTQTSNNMGKNNINIRDALKFNHRTKSYIDLSGKIFTKFDHGFTFAGWIKWNSFTYWSRIFDIAVGRNNNNIILANFKKEQKLCFDIRKNSERSERRCINVKKGEWMHIAVTLDYKPNKIIIYKNGSLALEEDYDTNILENRKIKEINRKNAFIGKSNWDHDGYFDGEMSNLYFFDKTLTPGQINKLFSNPHNKVKHLTIKQNITNAQINNDINLPNTDVVNKSKSKKKLRNVRKRKVKPEDIKINPSWVRFHEIN